MDAYYRDYLSTLEQLLKDFKSALHDLSPAALDWKPGSEMNSLAVLAVHTAGSLRYWIGDVVAEDPSDRDRNSEFLSQNRDVPFLESRLDASLEYTRSALEKMALGDLHKPRSSSRHDTQFTCAWALLHALEHTAQHTAHAQLTRQLWDQAHP